MAFGLGSSSSGGTSSGGVDHEKIEGAVVELVLFLSPFSCQVLLQLGQFTLDTDETVFFTHRLDMMTDVFNRMVSSVHCVAT